MRKKAMVKAYVLIDSLIVANQDCESLSFFGRLRAQGKRDFIIAMLEQIYDYTYDDIEKATGTTIKLKVINGAKKRLFVRKDR